MASNLNVTLKRHNGTDYDVLLPTTVVGQIYTDTTLTDTLQDVLDAKINLSTKGVASGVAPLNSSAKIDWAYLPDGVESGLKFVRTLGVSDTDLDALYTQELDGYANANSSFFIVGNTQAFTFGTTTVMKAPGDEGDSTSPVTLENGDWLIFHYDEENADTPTWYVVNNTLSAASATALGTVMLSNITTVNNDTTGNQVITQETLGNLIGTAANTIAAGNHNHDSVYQAKSNHLGAIAGLTPADGTFIVGDGTTWTAESDATVRSSLGLGSLATKNDINNTNWAGTDLSVLNGGTGASSAAEARVNLELEIGVDVQAYNSNLDTFSGYSVNYMDYLSTFLSQPITAGYMLIADGVDGWEANSPSSVRSNLDVYDTGQVNALFTNRPTIFYDTTTGAVSGSIIIDVD